MSARRLVYLVVVMMAGTTLAACQDSVAGPGDEQTPEPFRWAATYATAEKFGGVSGTWRLKPDVVITPDRRVQVNGREIVNPQIGVSSISWSIADGNATNASIQMLVESSSDYFWGDVGVAGLLFQGWIQYPGSGKLDYRGLAR